MSSLERTRVECWELCAKKDTNKKTSTYQCLKNQPLNFQHSFHFPAKAGQSKCNLVAKSSSEIRRATLRTRTGLLLDFASSLKGRVCNLRTTTNLEEEGNNVKGSILSVFLVLHFLSLPRPHRICFFSCSKKKGHQLTFQVLACEYTIYH